MERHKCKLCSRTFANGRALGGHMKAHLATLPLPSKPQPLPHPTTHSASLSYSESESEQQVEVEVEEQVLAQRETEEKALAYGLRENPKKSLRFANPEFSFAPDTGSAVQDRESETESKNPTRQRSKRNHRNFLMGGGQGHNQSLEEPKKVKLSFMESPSPPPPPTEPEPLSSISDTSPEEDVAMCLMMLSRDRWRKKNAVVEVEQQDQLQEERVERSKGCSIGIKFKKVRGKHQCDNCAKTFRSSRALGSHRSICCRDGATGEGNEKKIFECPFCFKVFGSGQALGGHKRSHLMASSSSTIVNGSTRLNESFIDLNLPAPAEEDDLSVVSDA